MDDLLGAVTAAHGGLRRWREIQAIDILFNYSGVGLEVKGFPRHLQPVCSIDPKQPRVVFQRLGGAKDDRWIFTPDRCWIERRDGSVLEERHHPRDAFKGHVWQTKWDNLHLTYFIGYAMWNYLAAPFLFHEDGFVVRETGDHHESGERWRKLEVVYPDHVPAHTKTQTLYFGPDMLLRRLDYSADVAGGVAAHYCFDHRSFGGIVIPTLRRVVTRNDQGPQVAGRTGFLLDYIDVEVR